MAGISEPRPAAFIIDESRRIRYAWAARKQPAFLDYDELEAAVKAVNETEV
jgi:peroxiredoxin